MSRIDPPNGPRDGSAVPSPDPRSSPTPFPLDPNALSWDDATSTLVALIADDLLQSHAPVPTVVAFAGDDPVAIVGLRPFDPGDVGQALLEVLSLLVPLGADRLAFGTTGRIWSLDDPIVPVCEEGDLRQRAIVIALADAHEDACTLATSIHPFEGTGADLALLPPVTIDGSDPDGARLDEHIAASGPAAAMLVGALEQRDELAELTEPRELVAQLGRVLLLGHDLALAPDPAASLTAASTG